MLNNHIENYKRIAESSAALIYDEKVKIFEYEAMLKQKEEDYQNIFFIRRWFAKNKKTEINTVNTYINGSINVIKQSREQIKKEKDKLIQLCVDNYIAQDEQRVAEYNKLKNDFSLKKRMFEIVDNSNKLGRNAVEWLFSTNREIKGLLELEQITDRYDDLIIAEINNKLGSSLRAIESFKKTINYASLQIKSINENENTESFINVGKVLLDDVSHSIVIRNTKRQVKANIPEINKTLAVLQVAHEMMNNERNRWAEIYNKSNNEFNRFWDDINLVVKLDLEKMDIKI